MLGAASVVRSMVAKAWWSECVGVRYSVVAFKIYDPDLPKRGALIKRRSSHGPRLLPSGRCVDQLSADKKHISTLTAFGSLGRSSRGGFPARIRR
eukprot:5274061-Prymnesium_polylepis.1